MNYPSKKIELAVNEISKLPGIGKKSALRLALHLLRTEHSTSDQLILAIDDLVKNTQICQTCFNIADSQLCDICSSYRRDNSLLAVVQDTRDVMAIENTTQYLGKYHLLGGIISPIQGIGPGELRISELIERVKNNSELREIILALSPTMEGDTTAYYIKKLLAGFDLKISTIARGIPIGGDLEYTDEITLGRSIITRVLF